jgi:D-alanyl-lipoteichoic acid acyltransferase DltB (MBOAT superfamily)
MRARSLLPQVLRPRVATPGAFEEGLVLILIGLVKKVAIADNVAPIANAVFSRLATGRTHELSGGLVLVGIYAFAIQIYGDFSGYSAIARGISKWLGFELVINFRQPYAATSPSDFWRRWHISLSSWLRDYLYIPLGGNRRGVGIEYRNLMITMLLGGLWHGASWTFVMWGLFHGLILCAFKVARVREVSAETSLTRRTLRVVLMFHLTCLGWLLFRADNFGSVARALKLLVTDIRLGAVTSAALVMIVFYAGLMFALEAFTKGEENLRRLFGLPIVAQSAVYTYLLFMIFVLASGRTYEFIYFQF